MYNIINLKKKKNRIVCKIYIMNWIFINLMKKYKMDLKKQTKLDAILNLLFQLFRIADNTIMSFMQQRLFGQFFSNYQPLKRTI